MQFALSGREGVRAGGVHTAPTKMPTRLLFWALYKVNIGAVSNTLFRGNTRLLYDTGDLHGEHVQDSGLVGCYAVQRVI